MTSPAQSDDKSCCRDDETALAEAWGYQEYELHNQPYELKLRFGYIFLLLFLIILPPIRNTLPCTLYRFGRTCVDEDHDCKQVELCRSGLFWSKSAYFGGVCRADLVNRAELS